MLQEQAADTDNARIHHDHRRALLTFASSNMVMEQGIGYGWLRLLAQLSEAADPAWAGIAYQEAPRALSADASMWTHWETPACPWTTWRASWADPSIHPPPPMKFPSRWRDRFLKRHQPKPGCKAESIQKKTTVPPPTIYKTSAIGSRFMEHLPENYESAVQKLRKQLARFRHQDRVVRTPKGHTLNRKTGTIVNKVVCEVSNEDVEDDASEGPIKKRNILSDLLCGGLQQKKGPAPSKSTTQNGKCEKRDGGT